MKFRCFQLVGELCRRYLGLSESDKFAFMQKLAKDFDVDRRSVCSAAQGYLDTVKNENSQVLLCPVTIPVMKFHGVNVVRS